VTRRQMRQLALAGFVVLACLVTKFLSPADRPFFQILSLGLGYASLILLFVGLVIGPLIALQGGRVPVSTMFRRDVGIWAAISGGIHVVFGLQSHMGGQILHYFTLAGQPLSRQALLFLTTNWLGLGATVILCGLLLLSNNVSLRVLGAQRWKFWQRCTYILVALTILHTFGYQILESRDWTIVVVMVAAFAVVFTLQLLGFVRTRPWGVDTRSRAV